MMLQVDKAYEHLINYADAAERNVRFVVSCSDRSRGVYLREAHKISKPSEHVVTVEPKHREADDGLSYLSLLFDGGVFLVLICSACAVFRYQISSHLIFAAQCYA